MSVPLGPRIIAWLRFFAGISYPRDIKLVLSALGRRRRFAIPAEVWAAIEPIDGFLSAKEAGLLYWAAREWPVSGPVIELGSYQGRSTVLFALAGRQVHAVDAWSVQTGDSDRYYLPGGLQPETSLALFQRNLRAAQVEARVSVHQGHTHDVGRTWGSPAAIVFVDAGHSYADARGDIDIWSPHLHPGGVLIMHDVLSYVHLDVARVASELIREDWRVVASAGSLVTFVRKDRKHA